MSGEIEFTKQWTKSLNDVYGLYVRIVAIVAGTRVEKGTPDRLIWHRKWSGYIEFKGQHTPLEPHQKTWIDHQNRICPGSAFVGRQDGCDYLVIEDTEGGPIVVIKSAAEFFDKMKIARTEMRARMKKYFADGMLVERTTKQQINALVRESMRLRRERPEGWRISLAKVLYQIDNLKSN